MKGRITPEVIANAKKTAGKTVKREVKTSKISDEQFLDALQKVGHPATSGEVWKKLNVKTTDRGRGIVRARMKKLISAGKVKSEKPTKPTKAKQLYSVA